MDEYSADTTNEFYIDDATFHIIQNGYWFTYHRLTDSLMLERKQALWIIWVARQVILHQQRKTLFTRAIDKLS